MILGYKKCLLMYQSFFFLLWNLHKIWVFAKLDKNETMTTYILITSDALRDFVPFVQFKKREKGLL